MLREPIYKSVYLYLTHDCNAWCTFCYRKGLYKRNDISKLGDRYMKIETADKILDYVFGNLQIHKDFHIYFWGGEPTLNMPVIKHVMEKYPQFGYHTNTNGIGFDENMYKFFEEHKNFGITWSFGNCYEKYRSVKGKLEAMPLLTKHIKDNTRHNINFMVTQYDKLYDDASYLIDNITPNVSIDIATKFDHTKEDLDKFATEYIRLIDKYKDNEQIYYGLNPVLKSTMWYRAFGPKALITEWQYCKSGLERLFVDTVGGIWQCDNMYVCQHNKLGDIYSGIDFSKLELQWDILDNPKKYLSQHCEGCELYGNCMRNKCLGLNLEYMGDMFKPEPSWCAMCKVLYRIAKHYINVEKERRYGNKA